MGGGIEGIAYQTRVYIWSGKRSRRGQSHGGHYGACAVVAGVSAAVVPASLMRRWDHEVLMHERWEIGRRDQ